MDKISDESVVGAVGEVLYVIIKHCDDKHTIDSIFNLGEDLYKLGLSTKDTRTKEWNDLHD